MALRELPDPQVQNQDAYDDLVVALEASEGALSLLIAVCDDSNLRDEITGRYEAELEAKMRCYRVQLDREEPSLKRAIAQTVESDEYLQQGGSAVFTVLGAEQLFFLKLGQERSQQEIFFGYLQWTREGLREFPYPIVLWVTNQLLKELSKKAPDFWSWRKGVFRFASRKTVMVSKTEMSPLHSTLTDLGIAGLDEEALLPLEDLQVLIRQTEQQRGTKDPLLASLYLSMGQIYARRLERGEVQDYQAEQICAIEYLRKAADLQKELGLEENFATSLSWLAFLYKSQGRYEEAEPLYVQALALSKRFLGEEHPHVAQSLNNLANLYQFQGRYEEAEPLLMQALALYKRLLGEEHPDVALSLNNLGGLYKSQGRYEEAEPLLMQALALYKRLLGEDHPDVATSLNNLAYLYKSQGRYEEAEPLLVQALASAQQCLGNNHPNTVTIRKNLDRLQQAIASQQPSTFKAES
ncbi:tetratricopeptide repeat protein [Trichocoleus sp. FACHB-591]|uniref:tetratricopeptide repeat protein n=1 Tax=Trichocoleus sp. FACHB-591 TaxID=2692872 RepID=UPI0016896A19|nr:tetratricopeptide repeat protein [Trichocoleus sp. FACHB-591]MBD2095338.1 tetratricopeptide repeat protein [Trichocoleus sp. FACHB-591]